MRTCGHDCRQIEQLTDIKFVTIPPSENHFHGFIYGVILANCLALLNLSLIINVSVLTAE